MSMDQRAAHLLDDLRRKVADGQTGRSAFAQLGAALQELIGYKVFTVLRIDPETLRSVRLHSSEPSYPVGGTKQHVRSAWSEAVFDRRTYFLARGLSELRKTFPDSAAIEAVGCGSVLAVPIVDHGRILGTVNLWHRDGYYEPRHGETALPFAAAIAPLVPVGPG